MKKIYLSGLGWVDENEQPSGIRLRWSYPFAEAGLPDTIVIERTELSLSNEESRSFIDNKDSYFIPERWWDNHNDLIFSSPMFNAYGGKFKYDLREDNEPIQRLKFTYKTTTNEKIELNIYDSNNILIKQRFVSKDDEVDILASDISRMEIISLGDFSGSNKRIINLKTCNLFKDHVKFGWEDIAEINVKETFNPNSNLETIKSRYTNSTIKESEWAEVIDVVNSSYDKFEDELIPDNELQKEIEHTDISKWDYFSLLLATRWEYSVLFGQGYCDGPKDELCPIDRYNEEKTLENSDKKFYIYRVYEKKYRGVEASNIFICNGGTIPSLSMPSSLTLSTGKIELNLDTDREKFTASYDLKVKHGNNAEGIEVEEETSGSLILNESNGKYDKFFRQNKLGNDETLMTHSREVSFHDEVLKCRVKAVDSWDRTSEYTNWVFLNDLEFNHTSSAPFLDSVKYLSEEGTKNVTISELNKDKWNPDIIVRNDPNAKIIVYRQKLANEGKVKSKVININDLIHISTDETGLSQYYVKVDNGILDYIDYENGMLFQASSSFKVRIQKISQQKIYFEINQDDNIVSLCNLGEARLEQDLNNLELWVAVENLLVSDYTGSINFNDFLPLPIEESDILSYHVRVQTLGQIGLASNKVQDYRIPKVLSSVPPFTIEREGKDFYNRTLIKIELKNRSSGRYSIWWAKNKYNSVPEFSKVAVLGELEDQYLYEGKYLYDILPLPIKISDKGRDIEITVGIKQVTESGVTSPFTISSFIIKTDSTDSSISII